MGRPRNPPSATGDDLADLLQTWAERGPEAIRIIREADAPGYLRLVGHALEAEALGGEDVAGGEVA